MLVQSCMDVQARFEDVCTAVCPMHGKLEATTGRVAALKWQPRHKSVALEKTASKAAQTSTDTQTWRAIVRASLNTEKVYASRSERDCVAEAKKNDRWVRFCMRTKQHVASRRRVDGSFTS